MNTIKKPVQVISKSLNKPRMDFFYPVIEGIKDSKVQQKINKAITDEVTKLIKESPYYQDPTTEITGGYELKTNERGVLSLSIIIYWIVEHAAHGMTVINSLTFDITTGEQYELKDLFKPGSNYVEVLSDIVAKQIEERDIYLLEPFKEIKPNQDYYIADKSLVLYFQLYELTAYAYGFPHFPISVYQIQDIVIEDGPLGRMVY